MYNCQQLHTLKQEKSILATLSDKLHVLPVTLYRLVFIQGRSFSAY